LRTPVRHALESWAGLDTAYTHADRWHRILRGVRQDPLMQDADGRHVGQRLPDGHLGRRHRTDRGAEQVQRADRSSRNRSGSAATARKS
jgi:hypothetical protein